MLKSYRFLTIGFLLSISFQLVLQLDAYSQASSTIKVRTNQNGQAFIVSNPGALIVPTPSLRSRTSKSKVGILSDDNISKDRKPFRPDIKNRVLSAVEKRNIANKASDFLQRYSRQFRIRDFKNEYTAANTNIVAEGRSSTSFLQRYKGVPIFGAYLKAMSNSQNDVYYSSGHYMEITQPIPTVPKISAVAARDIAMKDLFKRYDIMDFKKNIKNPRDSLILAKMFSPVILYIYNEDFLRNSNKSNYDKLESYKLVWHIKATVGGEISEEFLIDAITGAIFKNMDAREFAGGSEPAKILDCTSGCTCPIKRNGINAPAVGANPVYGGYDVDNSYEYFSLVRNYYFNEFGRYGANGLGGIGDGATSNFNESRSKTYYNGCNAGLCASGNAWYSSSPNEIVFCAGSLGGDVFGHEYFHAFNSNHKVDNDGVLASVFLTQDESGALNEAVADIFGEDFDTYMLGGPFDWETGTGTNITEKRSMMDPGKYSYKVQASNTFQKYPETYSSNTFYCGTEDFGGKYRNSTVISKALFLASVGTKGYGLTLDRFNGCQFDGIGLYKVVQILYYTIFNSTSRINNFNEFYDAVDMACPMLVNDPIENRYGVSDFDCRQMVLAMQAVQLDLPPLDGCKPNDSIPTCGIGFLPADCNLNGTVEGSDFLMLQRSYMKTGQNLRCDGNRDGIIDAADYTVWRDTYGASHTPEPSPSPGFEGAAAIMDGDAASAMPVQPNPVPSNPLTKARPTGLAQF